MKYIILCAFIAFMQSVIAQTCQTSECFQNYLNNHPELKAIVTADDANTVSILNTITPQYRGNRSGILKIPVVVHLIGDAVIGDIAIGNYSKINEQLEILNNDFRKVAGTNGDGLGVDTQIEFCLAQRAPNGTNTNGITETPGSFPVWDPNATPVSDNSDYTLKHLVHWPEDKYLNLYVVDVIHEFLGYSTFPIALTYDPDGDGVVIGVNYFGYTAHDASNAGRTLTHETGHWLNLKHTWGGTNSPQDCTVDDDVSDTPWCSGQKFAHTYNNCELLSGSHQCSTQNTADELTSRRQIENYMDYSDDLCANMFTQGQADRMRLTLTTTRASIVEPVEPIPLFSCEYADHCGNNIQDPDEEGIDCGGADCQPCDIQGGGSNTSSGPPNPCKGATYRLDVAGYYINGEKDGVIEVCVNEDITLSGPNHQSDCIAYLFPNNDNKLFISVTLCDEFLNPIDVEYTKWQTFSAPNLLVYSNNLNDFKYVLPFNLQDYLPSSYITFYSGQTYRVKIANSDYSGWREYTNYIHFYSDDRNINNFNPTSNIYGLDINISNSTINEPIDVIASNSIDVYTSTTLNKGHYYINETQECSNFKQSLQNTGNTTESYNKNNFRNYDDEVISKQVINDETNNNINIYPNPTNGIFTVNLDTKIGQIIELELIDILGNTIFKKSGDEVNYTFDLFDYPKGLYLLKTRIGAEFNIQKIIYQ